MGAFLPAIGAGLKGIGTFLSGPAGIGLMAVAGTAALISGGSKKRKLLREQDERARKALEEAENMPIPGLASDQAIRESLTSARELTDIGREQAARGLTQEERQLVLNRMASQNRFSDRGDIGSALKRIQETQGILQLGGAISQARREGAGIMAQGIQQEQAAAAQLQDVRNQVFAARNQRYNMIQQAAGQAFASSMQNQQAQAAANQQLGASLLSLAMTPAPQAPPAGGGGGAAPTANPSVQNDTSGGGGGGFLANLFPQGASSPNFQAQGNPYTQQP